VSRSREPLVWSLFSAGGMLAALLLPALVFVLWVAAPLGWLERPDAGALAALLSPPLARVAVLVVIVTALFHWAHRFRYTLYDGLQLHHLYGLIAVVCYGGAVLVSLAAVGLLLVGFG
jgi:fumarate reductase subunit D